MGMSIDQGPNIDLAAVIDGGAEFLKRMQAFKEAKDAAEQARENLGVAQNVIALRDEAARVLDQAKAEAAAERAKVFDEATQTRKSIVEWQRQTESDTLARQALVQAHLDDAAKKAEAATEAHAEAVSKLNAAQAQATQITSAASTQAAQVVSDAQTQADQILKQANDTHAKAKAAHEEVQALMAKYQDAMTQISAVASKVG